MGESWDIFYPTSEGPSEYLVDCPLLVSASLLTFDYLLTLSIICSHAGVISPGKSAGIEPSNHSNIRFMSRTGSQWYKRKPSL